MLNLLLPQNCLLCADPRGGDLGICAECLHDLPWLDVMVCRQCALPAHGTICGSCLKQQPAFDATQALFRYDYPLDRLLQHYKYQASLQLAHNFAKLWLERSGKSSLSSKPDLLIPMPMHPQRLKERGFNQALEIAKIISRNTDIKLDYTSCIRSRHTAPQASLPHKERVKNMRGAFSCTHDLTGKDIVILDDVITTGASLNELATTLKQAGAASVECWVIARTLTRTH